MIPDYTKSEGLENTKYIKCEKCRKEIGYFRGEGTIVGLCPECYKRGYFDES